MAAPTASLPVLGALPVRRVSTSGLVLAVASALAFSSSGPFIKPLLEAGWSLGAALLVRMGVAGLILSPALFLAMRRQPAFLRRHWKLILGFGLMPVLGCQLFFFSAMQRMPVAVALLIQYLAPVMLVAFVWLRTRKAPSALVLWGSAVAIVGLVLVVDISGASFDLIGTLFALGRRGLRVRVLRDLGARRRRPAAARPRRRGTAHRRAHHGDPVPDGHHAVRGARRLGRARGRRGALVRARSSGSPRSPRRSATRSG